MTTPRLAGLILLTLASWVTAAPASPKLGDLGAFRAQFLAGELFSEKQTREYRDYLPMEQEISWEVFVPNNYEASKPAGVLIYISPTRSGRIPELWKPVLAERNLIWISANKSGNNTHGLIRSIYAILGTELIKNTYDIDESRLFLSGFSGGGRMTSYLMQRFSHLYTGAIYICGVNYWDELPKEPKTRLKQRGHAFVNYWDELPEENKALMKQRRHVFLTGTRDFNYQDTVEVLKLYKKSGLRHHKLMLIKDMGHRLPDPDDLDAALGYLDGSL